MARIQYRPTHSPCHSSGQDDVGTRIQDHPPPHPHRPPRSHPRCPWLSMQDSSQLAVHVFNCIHHTHDTPCKRVRHQSSSAQPRLLESGIGSVCMPFSRWSSAVRDFVLPAASKAVRLSGSLFENPATTSGFERSARDGWSRVG